MTEQRVTVEQLIIQRLDRIESKVDLCVREVAGLKVKAGVWGAMAGMIPPGIGLIMWVLSLP